MKQNDISIIDAHVHCFGDLQDLDRLVVMEQEFGYSTFTFLSCECMDDASQNALGIYAKHKYPHCYAFGGLTYRYEIDKAKEIRALLSLGFDGVKMVENKPSVRKKVEVPLDDASYDEMYTLLEKEQIPLINHVGDPETFWNKNEIPPWAVEAGYYYGDSTFPTIEQLEKEVVNVLEKYPDLPMIMAHFFFLSSRPEKLQSLLDTYPNVGIDITPGVEMYQEFTKNPEFWREFFIRNRKRIFFGTDNYNFSNPIDEENAQITNDMQLRFLLTTETFPIWTKEQNITGIGLPEEVAEDILSENFKRIAGKKPKPLDTPKAIKYLEGRLQQRNLALTLQEQRITEQVLQALTLDTTGHR